MEAKFSYYNAIIRSRIGSTMEANTIMMKFIIIRRNNTNDMRK
jgi:hypothetical protein